MRWLPWVLLAVVVLVLAGSEDDLNAEIKALEQRIEARETVIAALAKQKARVVVQYEQAKGAKGEARVGWDSIKVTLEPKHPIRIAGDKLADACDEVERKCDELRAVDAATIAQQTDQLSDLGRLVEKERQQSGGTLFVFGDAGLAVDPAPPYATRAEGEAGAALRIGDRTYLHASASTAREIRVTVRKYRKLF